MKSIIFRKYNTVGEFAKHLENADFQKAFAKRVQYGGSQGSRFSFYGTKDYKEADRLLLFGDKDLQKKIEEAGVYTTRMRLKYQANKKQVYSSVVGFAPNVPAYIAGAPNSMINQRQIKARQRVVTIMYNTSVSCCVSADEIIKATAQMISAVMLLEANGLRVNVYVGEVTKCTEDEQKFGWLLRIKDSGQKIDTLKMSYPLAHPSMLRRHAFKLLETTPDVSSGFVNNYGMPINSEKESMDILEAAGVNNIQRVLSFGTICGKNAEDIAKMITGEAK